MTLNRHAYISFMPDPPRHVNRHAPGHDPGGPHHRRLHRSGDLDRERRARFPLARTAHGCATSRFPSSSSCKAQKPGAKRGGESSRWTISIAMPRRAAAISASPRWWLGRMPAVITQNIDGLHQASGLVGRSGHRAARQRHLCGLPLLRPRHELGLSGSASRRRASRRAARLAAASSSRPRSHSARPCLRKRCAPP